MRHTLFALLLILCISPSAVLAQQPVKLVDNSGTDVPLSTVTEAQHDTALGTVTNIKGYMLFCRGTDSTPTAVSANDDAALGRCFKDGTLGIAAVAQTSGGCTPYKLNSVASTNATSLKASAGMVYRISASNINAAVRYLKLYDKASAPSVGTDTPIQVLALAPSGAQGPYIQPSVGMVFSNGIAFAITTGAADSDTGAVAANDIIVNACYK